ncbi:MAG: hypothetical protein ACYTHJ_07615 [Planctomycetota bacterium]|jgi:hypothetical protein
MKKAIPISLALLAVLVMTAFMATRKRAGLSLEQHLEGMEKARQALRKVDPDHANVAGLGNLFRSHREALVELGYLELRRFPLLRTKANTLGCQRMLEEIRHRFPNAPGATLDADDETLACTVIVRDRPEVIPAWQDVIRAHDAPALSVVAPDIVEANPDLSRMLGTWTDPSGKLSYMFSKRVDDSMRIDPPPVANWMTEIRNVEVSDGSLHFDQFHYLTPPARQSLKPGEQDPFEGIRCEITLQMDGDVLQQSLKTIHLEEPSVSRLTRRY